MVEFIYGRNAVRECLRAQRRHIHQLQLAKNLKITPPVQEILELAHKLQIPVQQVSRRALDGAADGHQGVLMEVGRLPLFELHDLLNRSSQGAEAAFFLALDHIEDPHNAGALLRTAEAVGVHGVLMPGRRSVGITPTVVKTSSGATEHLSIAIVSNLVQALNSLKKEGIWVVGLDRSSTSKPFHQVDLNMPLILVLGSEGKGLSRLTSKTCDLLLEIPMRGRIASLNVSVAGALGLYEAWRARQFALI